MRHRAVRLVVLLVLTAVLAAHRPVAAQETAQRSWKTLDELSAQELQAIDRATDTPRHPEVPYLPAEPYPFSPPYTAEEMGYKLMEYNPRPRWSGVVANSWASIGDTGVLLNPGKSITFVDYSPSDRGITGVQAEFRLKPGEEVYRSLSQGVAPPVAEGSQWIAIHYRTDKSFHKKEERFRYSSSIRRVRHQVPRRRQSRFPNMALTPDDSYGRDAWEFRWRILGTDVVDETIRFPHTRPTITLRDLDTDEFRQYQTQALKPMGESYPYYRADGGVEAYVVEAVAREDWLPNYYVPRLIFWLDKHTFFPLRVEQYGPDGRLIHIEVRMADLFNPGLGEHGYGTRFIVHWHIPGDIMSYMCNDSHKVIDWDEREAEIYFNPDFMRRQWYLDTSIKTQAEVKYPEEFFLRPHIWPDRFPDQRPIHLSAAMQTKLHAQNTANRLVFQGDTAPVQVAAEQTPVSPGQTGTDEHDTAARYVQNPADRP